MSEKVVKIINSFIVVFVFFFIVQNTFASEWIKYETNPILAPTSGWDSQLAAPAIIFDDNKFKMWYQGYDSDHWSIGYAESSDGINWQKPVTTPVLTPQNQNQISETGVVEPVVIKNGLYQMWFNSQNNDIYHIRYATSTDGINWQKHADYVLSGEIAWEAKGVANPYVIFKDGKYLMWYMGWGFGPWKIGLAESTDGINWTKYENNPLQLPNLGHVGGQSVIFINGKFQMFYHTGGSIPNQIYQLTSMDGINWSCDGDCSVLSTSSSGFDSYMTVYPEIFNHNNNLYLYYTGHNGSNWSIGLATQQPLVQEKIPIVLIPGLMASWNKEAILHNQPVSIFDWKLLSFIKEYNGLIESLKKLPFPYIENQDFFLFPYDWRKSVEETTNDLSVFLQQKIWNNNPNQKINIVGHSLGGLVGRIFTQKNKDRVNQNISVASPHLGAVQVYKPLEAGEIDRENTFLWLAEKLILALNKSSLETDRQTIQNRFPVAKDLFPTFNFLKDSDGNEISVSQMSMKNDLLENYNQSFSDIFPLFTAIYGEKDKNTPSGFTIESPSSINQLLGNYKDGQPKITNYDLGDYTVLSKSASQDTDSEKLNFDHGEIIIKSESIKKILTLLNIAYQDTQIVEGQKTLISPSLIFMIKSPATMTVEFNNQIYQEEEGIIFIPDAQSGNYLLKVQGTDLGKYTVHVGQISENNDLWEKIEGEITQSPAEFQTDDYYINYNNQTALSIFPTLTPTSAAEVLTEEAPTVTPELTSEPTSAPTTILQSTNSLPSTNSSSNNQSIQTLNNEPFLSKESSPSILGTSILETTKQKTEKPQSKNSSIWDYIWPSITSLILGGIAYIFRKKILKK